MAKMKKSNIWWIVLGAAAVIVIILAAAGVFKSNAPVDYTDRVSDLADYSTPGVYALGNPDAPVTIIEWSDFQCPFCERFYTQTSNSIIDIYVRTGKARFIYKEFPLTTIHPYAYDAAMAAECAGEQQKFWQFYDIAYENQASLNRKALTTWAQTIGLDMEQFNSCMAQDKYADKINSDTQEGLAAGVKGTPAFTINGKFIEGAQPFSVFDTAIQEALNANSTSE